MALAATKIGAAYVEIDAKTDKYTRGLQVMNDQTRRSTESVRREIDKTDARIKGMTGSVGMLTSAIATIGGAAALGQLVKIADTFTQMRGRLSLVVKEGENLLDVEERLYQLALKNRAAIEPTIALYARLRSARSDLTDEQALKIVDTWNKTLVISGASAGGAAAATIQLSQAMAGGVLRAEEFNSIVENNIRAVQLFAQSLGTDMGGLRKMVNEGTVGFDDLVKAMTTDAGAVGDEFGKMEMTVGQSLTNVQTAMTRFIGLTNTKFEGSKKLAEWVNLLADNFEMLATAALVAGASVASALAGQFIFGMIGSLAALAKQMIATGNAAKALGLAMAWKSGPWGIALGAIAAALVSIHLSMTDLRTASEKAADAAKDVADQIKKTDEAIARANQLKGYKDDLDGVARAADEATLKLAELNKQLVGGRGAQIEAEQQQWEKNFQLINAIAAVEADMANTRTRVFVDRSWVEVDRYSPAQLAQKRRELEDLRKQLAEGQKRLKDIQDAPASVFDAVQTTPKVGVLEAVTEKQLQLERARADNKKDLAARLEDEIKVIQLAATLQEKGLNADQAQARAVSHVAAIRRAINADDEKQRSRSMEEASLKYQLAIAEAEGDKQRVADLETQLEINRRIIALEEQGLALDAARAQATEEVNRIRNATKAATDKEIQAARELRDLEYQMALAAADGNEKQEKALKRELDIRREMKDLMTLGYSETEARTVATYRVDTLALKDPTAWDGFERGVSDATKRGLMTAIETGDWGDAFGQILTDVTRDALSRALDVLWEALAQIDWNGQGTGWAGFFNMVGTSFAGNKAGGGDVTAGRMYRVGELGSEWFIPKVDGQIVPNAAGKQLASQSIMIGAPVVNVYGNADSVTRAEIAETLGAFSRGLPAVIDARVTDRKKRGAY